LEKGEVAMDTTSFRRHLEERAFEIMSSTNEDTTKYHHIKILSEEEINKIADEIEIEEHFTHFFKNKRKKGITITKSKEIIHVGRDFSVIHFTYFFDKGNWPQMDKMYEDIKNVFMPQHFGCYLYYGEECWDWGKVIESRGILLPGETSPKVPPKSLRETKEIELAKRSANFVVNKILIKLYERLIVLYPDNVDLYNALCNILENNCLFDKRIQVLEDMFNKFGDIWMVGELYYAYADNGDNLNARRVKRIIDDLKKGEKNEKTLGTGTN